MNLLGGIPTAPTQGRELPVKLAGLERLATNFYYRRDREAAQVFHDLDPELWAKGATPMSILMDSKGLAANSEDKEFLKRLHLVLKDFDTYMGDTAARHNLKKAPVAYFCAEFGIHQRVPIYCGGLGILAGDHCMEASDMNLPFVAVGLFYRRGFPRQLLDFEGRQEHSYPLIEPARSGLLRVLDPKTQKPLTVNVELPGRVVHAAVWLAAVGRMPLLLLDTDVLENKAEDRPITSQLYTIGREMRICQEMVLGVGGVRALNALKIEPAIFHLNEGHSAHLLIERLRQAAGANHTLKQAMKKVKESSVLTIHTPVPEGNERFDADLMKRYLQALLESSSVGAKELLKLGLDSKADPNIFDMTAFALRLTFAANGVSLLHGHTADNTWRPVVGRHVTGVTNGIHMKSWLGPEMRALYLKNGVKFEPAVTAKTEKDNFDRGRWSAAEKIDDAELWAAHIAQKKRLAAFAGQRLLTQQARNGDPPSELEELLTIFDPEAFTIGFARRFATYKRGALIFSNEKKLSRILSGVSGKVQIVISGKAYPTDREGQAVVEKVYKMTQDPKFKGKVFILEDYDMEVGAMLVQGVDLWLNNPRRPLEASGTSGMKAAANGVPNASILDGWWDEAFKGGKDRNGFQIGSRTPAKSLSAQDKADAKDLYRVLEEEVIPLYFDKDKAGLPREWLKIMKNSMADSISAFSTRRMIDDYVKMYEEG
ncbi:MAG TPA: alpha-glucan family phosphorylase [Fimbriimonadaceae bacterium]|jgi:starch phosphorylase